MSGIGWIKLIEYSPYAILSESEFSEWKFCRLEWASALSNHGL